MVPLRKAICPPDIPFKVIFCLGGGRFQKLSRYGLTQHNATESTIACVNSFVEALVAINITNFNSALFSSCVIVCRGGTSSSSLAASGV
jgi:hypothetical protein